MKGLQIRSAVFFLVMALISCDTKTNEKTESTPDTAALTQPAPSDLNSNQSALLTTILGSAENGILRGIAFGDPLSKVKATETFEMFEETADHLGYTSETAKLETIDVQYFFTPDKKVNKITVDVYLNSPEATKQLWNAAKAHFTESYATPKEEKKTISWNTKAVKVNMEDVSVGKDYGLKFQFSPTDKTALAAK